MVQHAGACMLGAPNMNNAPPGARATHGAAPAAAGSRLRGSRGGSPGGTRPGWFLELFTPWLLGGTPCNRSSWFPWVLS